MHGPNPGPLDVLQVVPTLQIGGLERVVAHLCMGLRGDLKMGVACLRCEGPFADTLREAGVPVLSWGSAETRRDAYSAPFRLRRLVKDVGVRLLHSHNTAPWFCSVSASLGRAGTDVVHTDHARSFPDKWRRAIGERFCSRMAHSVVAVSEHGKRQLVQYEGIEPARIEVIPNGVDTAPFETLTPPPVDPARRIKIGTAVRFTDQKQLCDLVAAVGLLVREGLPVQLRLAGDGPQRADLEQQARTLGITEHVEFLGYCSDIPAVLGELDIYTLSSVWEGMPMGLIEAMAAARPAVCTDVGGVSEVIQPERTGLLVPARNPEAMAAALRRLVTQPAWARELGLAGRERALQEFTLDAMCGRYAALYEQVLKRGTASAA